MAVGDYYVDENGDYLVDGDGDYQLVTAGDCCCGGGGTDLPCDSTYCTLLGSGSTVDCIIPDAGWLVGDLGCTGKNCDTSATVTATQTSCSGNPKAARYSALIHNPGAPCDVPLVVNVVCFSSGGWNINAVVSGTSNVADVWLYEEATGNPEAGVQYSLTGDSRSNPCLVQASCHCYQPDSDPPDGTALLTINEAP